MKNLIHVFIVLVFFACKDDNANISIASKELNIPELDNNTVSAATIGKVLFYDTRLSVNNSVSCASCHKQTHGFADDKSFSTGFQNESTERNSLAISNSGNSSLFWDGRESVLQTMVFRPLTNHVEMGMADMDAITERVKNVGYYQELFFQFYNDDVIDINRINACLTTFVSSIRPVNTKFDKFRNGQASLTPMEEEGRNLFFDIYPCGSCHNLNVSGYGNPSVLFSNIGLDLVSTDQGRGVITQLSSDEGKFKAPSLKNVAVTYPYMHDGRFSTLEDVLDHYSHGIMDHQNLDDRLKDASGQPLKLEITAQQKQSLIAFLSTLTDYDLMSDNYFADPFVK